MDRKAPKAESPPARPRHEAIDHHATGRASRACRSDSSPSAIERAVRIARSEPRNGSRCSTPSARRRTGASASTPTSTAQTTRITALAMTRSRARWPDGR